MEWCILIKYEDNLLTSDILFGFKSGISMTLCIGIEKNVISRYLYRGSTVFTCFLDTSKAFDLMQHSFFF